MRHCTKSQDRHVCDMGTSGAEPIRERHAADATWAIVQVTVKKSHVLNERAGHALQVNGPSQCRLS